MKYAANIVHENLATENIKVGLSLKLLDDNPLIPPKCSEVVVRIPVKYMQWLARVH